MSTLHQATDSSEEIVPIMVRMPQSLFDRFHRIQKKEGRSRSRTALKLIGEAVEQYEKSTRSA